MCCYSTKLILLKVKYHLLWINEIAWMQAHCIWTSDDSCFINNGNLITLLAKNSLTLFLCVIKGANVFRTYSRRHTAITRQNKPVIIRYRSNHFINVYSDIRWTAISKYISRGMFLSNVIFSPTQDLISDRPCWWLKLKELTLSNDQYDCKPVIISAYADVKTINTAE